MFQSICTKIRVNQSFVAMAVTLRFTAIAIT